MPKKRRSSPEPSTSSKSSKKKELSAFTTDERYYNDFQKVDDFNFCNKFSISLQSIETRWKRMGGPCTCSAAVKQGLRRQTEIYQRYWHEQSKFSIVCFYSGNELMLGNAIIRFSDYEEEAKSLWETSEKIYRCKTAKRKPTSSWNFDRRQENGTLIIYRKKHNHNFFLFIRYWHF